MCGGGENISYVDAMMQSLNSEDIRVQISHSSLLTVQTKFVRHHTTRLNSRLRICVLRAVVALQCLDMWYEAETCDDSIRRSNGFLQ